VGVHVQVERIAEARQEGDGAAHAKTARTKIPRISVARRAS
jgi:hypothetical protein